MKKIMHIFIYITIVCVGMQQSKAQTIEVGDGFTIDGIDYEVLGLNPNEVTVDVAQVVNQVVIPSAVTFQNETFSVVSIAAFAFEFNALTSITIPATIETIGFHAFFNTGLTEIIALGATPPVIDDNSFENRSTIAVTVPTGAENDYINNGWIGFATINGINPNFEVNNITYSLNTLTGNTVAVVGSSITGSGLTIPSSIIFNSTTYTVTEIASSALENNQLTSVTLPNTLTKIGSSAFKDNQLTTVSIPNTITELPERVFENNQLTSVTFPNALTSIGNDVFRDNQFTTITLPNTITTMGERAFFNNQLTNVTISSGITILENSVFRHNNLSTLTIPTTVTEIGIFAFGNNNLTTITIPASVTSIGNFAFWNNPLASVNTLGTTPPVIGDPAFTFGFFDMLGAIDLTVPTGTETTYANAGWVGFGSVNGVVAIAINAVFTENDFDYKITSLSPNEVEIVGGTNVPQILVINSTVTTQNTDFTITSVGQSAFENANLTSVQLPNTLRVIRNFAFQSNQLTNISIPTSVTNIGFRAFRFNQIGGDLVIPNSVTSLGNGAFEINNLTGVTISEGISAIGNQTFRSNQLTTVTIPANVNSLGNNCFRSNPLTEVIVLNTTPPSINGGSGDSFLNIRGNIALTVPASTELEYLTNGWTGFASINGEDPAFFNEFEVDNITYRITKLNPNEVVTSDATVSGDLIIPTTVSKDEQNFTVSSIASDAFRDEQLTSVIIPASITSIGARAFRGNPLTKVVLEGFSPPTINNQTNNNNTFSNRSSIDVFVRTGNVQSYINAGWTGFKAVNGVFKALLLKAYLQGASLNPFTGEENLMRDDLRTAGLLPFISPYEDALTVFDTIYVEITDGPDAIVDWIYIELRDRTDSTIVIEGRSALLQRDGDIVDVDAISPVEFSAPTDDYFITLKHRNHLGIMTATTKGLRTVANIVDFTDANNPITFGSNAQTTASMPANTLGMWTGNVNGDNIVQYSGTTPDAPAILSLVLNDPGNFLNFPTFVVNDYNVNDLDMDGRVQYSGVSPDAPFILQNVLAHPGNFLNFSTFQIQEQLPEN
jgi:hypothetical protein